jgi:putative endonuclease
MNGHGASGWIFPQSEWLLHKRYGVHQLVWYELHENMESAIVREKRLKEWKRVWKLELIESANPDWDDLYDAFV